VTVRNTISDDLRIIAEHVYYSDAPALLGITPERLERYVTEEAAPRPGTANYKSIKAVAARFRSQSFQDILTVHEYLTIADAAKLTGSTKRALADAANGRATLSADVTKKLHAIAVKMRRREGQLERVAREQLDRAARRSVHAQLRAIGMFDVHLPQYLPPFLRYHEHGKQGTPVYIYDFRKVNTFERVSQFFRFMKTVLPSGSFFLTYAVRPGGTTLQGGKNYYVDRDIIISTPYTDFCRTVGRDVPGGSCLMMTDVQFWEHYQEVGNASSGRIIIECGISHRRPPMTQPHYELTPEEIAEDEAMSRDWVLGKKIIWRD